MAQELPRIYLQLGPSVARIEFEGELYNGEHEQSTGSAFLVSDDGLLLTAKHVLPNPADYKTVKITARLGSLRAHSLDVEQVWVSPKDDVAILRVNINGGSALPLQTTAPDKGVDIVTLGFPVTLDLNITKGIVSGSDGNKLLMDAAINPGNSGGPIIGPDGRVVGVAWGSHIKWKLGGTEVPLEGIKIFVPISAFINDVPAELRNAFSGTLVQTSSNLPPVIRRSHTVDVTKDDHPVILSDHSRDYEFSFDAEPGYEISSANLIPFSDTRVSHLLVTVSNDRQHANVRFRLTSGPALDRYRGWLRGTLELTEILLQ